MSKLSVFTSITLDGYFTGADGDMSWAHKRDPEWQEFSAGNARGDGTLLFGRVTYQMMASYWPTALARQNSPELAEHMNRRSKVVLSRTLRAADWQNTRLLNGELESEVRKLKQASPEGVVILGSGSIIAQLAPLGLIDEYTLVVNATALGKGRTIFEGLPQRLDLKLTNTRSFANGNVVLSYRNG